MSNANGEAADWFGQGGQSIPDMATALAVTASQLQSIKFGWRAMMEINALATGRAATCQAIFGDGSVKVARARAASKAASDAAMLYEELVHTLEQEVHPAVDECVDDNT